MSKQTFDGLIINGRSDIKLDFIDKNIRNVIRTRKYNILDNDRRHKIDEEIYNIEIELDKKLQKIDFIYESYIKTLFSEYKLRIEQAFK